MELNASTPPDTRLPQFVSLDATEMTVEEGLLQGQASVSCLSAKCQEDVTAAAVAGAEFVAVWHTIWLTPAVLDLLRSARCVVRMGVGYDNVDVEHAGSLGIPVCNIPNYGTEEVADQAMAHVLGLLRQSAALAVRVALGERIQGPDGIAAAAGPTCRRLRAQTLGLVGLGRIGIATAVRAKAFGLDVVFYDPAVSDGMDKALGVRRAGSLLALAAQSDCLSLHCNATRANERMINREVLRAMKPGAFLVNTARGELVDEAELVDALTSRQLAGAALDVHWSEPFVVGEWPRGGGHRCEEAAALVREGRLLCTPHSAWYSVDSRHEMRKLAVDVVQAVLRGEPLRNVVNKAHLVNPRCTVSSDA